MKKITFLLYFSVFVCIETSGQDFGIFSQIPDSVLLRIEEMGKDDSDTLSELECLYFRFRFPSVDTNYQYAGKKIFFRHAFGRGKIYFFSEERRLLYTNGRNRGMVAAIYFLDESEKQLYDVECDVVVHCWPKIVESKERIVRKIKHRNKRFW